MKVLVISSYPEKALLHGVKTVGVGYYTKATLLSLIKENPSLEIKVFAEVFDKKEEYKENKITVERRWKRGNLLSILSTFLAALKHESDVILLPFEMYMFGGFIKLFFVLKMMLLLRLSGKKVVLVLHQVLGSDLSTFEKNNLKRGFFSFFRTTFYKYLLFISTYTVVFEEDFKSRLGGSDKVVVIPHAVLSEVMIDKYKAREELGFDKNTTYFFYFGFLSPYKGVDKLLEQWEKIDGVKLVVGGGINPNHKGNPVHEEYVEKINKLAKEKGAIVTGFIPEDKMKYYFSSVDVVVLPYTVFMSSSGPLGHAFTWGKGVIFSDKLRGYFNSPDLKDNLNESGISIDEICFDLEKPIKSKVLWASHNINKLQDFSSRMSKVRSWSVIGRMYYEILLKAKL